VRILYLNQTYVPEPAKLFTDLVQTFERRGHTVTVLTGFPNYPAGKIYPGYRQRLWQAETIEGTRVLRMPLYPDHSQSAIRRALNYASLSLSTTCIAPWVVPPFDVIFGVRPITLGLPAWFLGWLRRKPFVVDIADMWPETLSATGMLTSRFAHGLVEKAANLVCRQAGAVRVISPGFRENLVGKGIPRQKVHVIPDWVDTDTYYPKPPDAEWARELGLAGRFNVLYAGTVGLSQGLESALDAAAMLADLPQVQFVFSGGLGVARDQLRATAEQRGLNNVRFLGFFPEHKMSDLYALTDVLLVQLRETPLSRITIPHKIYAYMAVGKPILAAIVGDTRDAVLAAQAGLACPPCNPQEVAATVRAFWGMSADQRQQMGRNGRKAAEELYSTPRLTAQVAQLVEDVAARRLSRAQRKSASSPPA
jgi:glycosyltransferase involved in cell wall biosynthesis